MIVSWRPGEVSSSSNKIGRSRFVTGLSHWAGKPLQAGVQGFQRQEL